MILPFHRSWLRSPWLVLGLVAVAVLMWIEAIGQLRDIAMKARTRDALVELQQACDVIATQKTYAHH